MIVLHQCLSLEIRFVKLNLCLSFDYELVKNMAAKSNMSKKLYGCTSQHRSNDYVFNMARETKRGFYHL